MPRSHTVARLIEHARAQARPYAGSFDASWNLTSFDSEVWILQTPATRRCQDGSWAGVIFVRWKVLLPDGSHLTDITNTVMLTTMKKVLVLATTEPDGIKMSGPLLTFFLDLTVIVKWMYIHKTKYHPEKFGFALLDRQALESFMTIFIKEGNLGVLNYHGILIKYLYDTIPEISFSPTLMEDPYHLPAEDVRHIIKWFEINEFYIKRGIRKYDNSLTLSRKKIAKLIGTEAKVLTSEKITAFFRQFEPDLVSQHSLLLLPVASSSTEYISHNVRTISEVINAPITYTANSATLSAWERIFTLHRHIPDYLPTSDHVKFSATRKMMIESSTPNSKTPWIPLPIALKYTNESLRMVLNFGPALKDFYIKAVCFFFKNGLFNVDEESTFEMARKRNERNKWVQDNIPQDLQTLNINGWTTNFHPNTESSWNSFRQTPSLSDLITTLIGATLVLTTTLKPMRMGEVCLLKKDCILYKSNDGYYLKHVQEKRNTRDVFTEIIRPVPRVVADALSLLVDISDALKLVTSEADPYSCEMLMYFCGVNKNATIQPSVMSKKYLISCIDRFCDWVNTDPDEYGRRWYYRVHEGRKSFLITFFWCFKYASLGAASWMAGHGSWKETLTYITSSFPGDELPEFEAQYAAEQLWQLEKYGNSEASNTRQLYLSICDHFNVTQVNLIPENDLRYWLKKAFEEKIYSITPIIIQNSEAANSVEVAFKIKKGKPNASRKGSTR